MNPYPFRSLTINGREVELNRILDKTVTARSGFETSTFLFIQQWFTGNQNFAQNTSGSTGTPKSITITRDQMVASARLTAQALALKAGDTSLVCLDPAYIAGKMMLVRSFEMGMKIVALNPSKNPFLDLPPIIPVDFTAIVPMQLYEILLSNQSYRLNSIKNILVGGAALNETIQQQLSQFSGQVHATYGMTETVSHVALQPINGSFASEYFTVLPGIEINTDDRGCLEIYAPYLHEKIITNDLVEIKGASQFKWLGRADHIINTGGIKVIPEKIEASIYTIFVQQAVENKFLVSSLPDNVLGHKLVLLVEGNLRRISAESITNHLRKILPPHEVPKEIYTNIDFVFTENGKVNRVETARQIGN